MILLVVVAAVSEEHQTTRKRDQEAQAHLLACRGVSVKQ